MRRILIADDCIETLLVLRLLLEDFGHRVECVNTRDIDMLRTISKFEPEIALLDIQMPGLPVEDVIGALQCDERPVRIALASGDHELGRAIAEQFHLPLLEKPFSGEQLFAALNIGENAAA